MTQIGFEFVSLMSAAFFDHERISEKISFNVNSCISDAVGIGIDCSECLAVNAM